MFEMTDKSKEVYSQFLWVKNEISNLQFRNSILFIGNFPIERLESFLQRLSTKSIMYYSVDHGDGIEITKMNYQMVLEPKVKKFINEKAPAPKLSHAVKIDIAKEKITKIITELKDKALDEFSRYKTGNEEMKDDGFTPHAYLCKRTANLSIFKNNGGGEFLNEVIENMIDNYELELFENGKEIYDTNAKIYRRGPNFNLTS